MVFSGYNGASYLPLDNDQSITFYKNENRHFPTAISLPTMATGPGGLRGLTASPASGMGRGGSGAGNHHNMSTTDLLTAAYHQQQQHHAIDGSSSSGAGGGGSFAAVGDCPFVRVQSPAGATALRAPPSQQLYHHRGGGGGIAMCDDFQPVANLNGSSNGYYGYVPTLAPVAGVRSPPAAAAPHGQNNNVLRMTPADNVGTTAMYSTGRSLLSQHRRFQDPAATGGFNNNNNNNEVLYDDRQDDRLQRKRKEVGSGQDDEAMDEALHTGGSDQLSIDEFHPKRRKTDAESMMQPSGSSTTTFSSFPPALGGAYERHLQPVSEMECQEHHHHHPPGQSAIGAASFGFPAHLHHQHQQPHPHSHPQHIHQNHNHSHGGLATVPEASKSKYFDSNRCMMSHMI
ncbi:ell-associated factor Eaf-like [Anopheles cruzii]|uniref:ell-associated factor Eaf-like n=1 Tax=Anopheles cruzii TaxID=68878 RepID=UPI0022EC721F|nr:ell-associated factor Eaf-like [Anopheles cruzii]